MHINSGLSDSADYDSVMDCNLDTFYQEYKDTNNIIIIDDSIPYNEFIANTVKGLSSHESVTFYDCTSILNQYKAWFKFFKNVQPFYGFHFSFSSDL